MSDSNLDHLLLFCAGWWVFATIAAFLAALLFWNKGASQLSGQAPGMSSMAVKLGGASAICPAGAARTVLTGSNARMIQETMRSVFVFMRVSHPKMKRPEIALCGEPGPAWQKARHPVWPRHHRWGKDPGLASDGADSERAAPPEKPSAIAPEPCTSIVVSP